MSVSVAAGHVKAGRWALAVAPVVAAVLLMVVFGLAAGGAAATRPADSQAATNPMISVPRLLTAGDAGRGWTATHSGGLVAEPAGCLRPRAAMMRSAPRSLVGVVLTGPGGLPQVDELAARYPTASAAASGFTSVERNLDGCRGPVPTAVPVRSDRSAAALVTTGTGSRTAGVDFVVARKGTGVVLLVYGSAGVPDSAAVSRLADRAVERLGP